jgi:iron complex outermembrane receptor protein
LKYLFPKTEKSEFVIGSSIMSQENKNNGEEFLIPDVEKNDIGFYGISHLHTQGGDFMLGLRADFRKIKKLSFNKNYSSLNASFGYKVMLEEKGIMRLNLSSGYRAPNLSELFSEGVHHGTAQYEIGNKDLMEEKSFQADFALETYTSNSTFGVDVFINKLSNFIYLNPTGNKIEGMPVYNYVQNDATLLGMELYADRETSLDWLSYKTSLSLLNGKKSGGFLPLMPPITFKHSFNFDFGNNHFELRALAKGEKKNLALFETKTNSYLVVGVSGSHNLNLLDNNIDLSWSVNNLFDTEYYDHLSRLKNIGIYEMGRNISIGLNYKF